MLPPPTKNHSAPPNDAPSISHRSIPVTKLQKFRGKNVSQFLNLYEMYWSAHGWGSAMMALRLPLHVKTSFYSIVCAMPGYKESDWNALKRSMRASFCDEEIFKYSLADLKRFVKERRQRGKPESLKEIRKVYLRFTDMSLYLKKLGVIGPQEESRHFLQLLPSHIVHSIFARSDARNLFSEIEGKKSEDEETLLPGIQELFEDVKAVYATLAGRGKSCKNWSRRQQGSSDTESEFQFEGSDSDITGSEEEEEAYRPKRHTSSRTRSQATRTQRSDSSQSPRNAENTHLSEEESEDERSKLDMGNLFSRFEELQLSVNQLVAQQAVTYHLAPTAQGSKKFQHLIDAKPPSPRRFLRNPARQNPKVSAPTPLAEPI
ncbi:hypothetical protein P7C70_g9435, partial [Phenoliferia sp. Uapishka_3]